MFNEFIQQILSNDIYQNGEQPDIILDMGLLVDSIECVGTPKADINFSGSIMIIGICKIYTDDSEEESVTVTGEYTIEIDTNNDITVSYGDFEPEL